MLNLYYDSLVLMCVCVGGLLTQYPRLSSSLSIEVAWSLLLCCSLSLTKRQKFFLFSSYYTLFTLSSKIYSNLFFNML